MEFLEEIELYFEDGQIICPFCKGTGIRKDARICFPCSGFGITRSEQNLKTK